MTIAMLDQLRLAFHTPADASAADTANATPVFETMVDGEFSTDESALTRIVNRVLEPFFPALGASNGDCGPCRQAQRQSDWILDSVGSGIHGVGRDGKIIFQNRTAAILLGWDSDELLGQPAHTMHHQRQGCGATHRLCECPILATLQDGLTRRVNDENMRRKDGSLMPAWYLVSAMRDDNGAIVGAVVLFCDVTRYRALERTNVENARLVQALFQNADSAIVDADISLLFNYVRHLKQHGIADLREYALTDEQRLADLAGLVRMMDLNPAARSLLGLADGDIPAPVDCLPPRETSLMVLDVAEAMFRDERFLRQETDLVTLRGERVPILQSLLLPTTDEEAKRVHCVMIDLRLVKMAETARAATIAKSDFLASMSHEIRTPLNGVIGNLELLGLTSPTGEQCELIEQAEKAAKSLLALVGNILDFSKIEQGKLTIEMGEVNPSEIVMEAVAVLQSRAQKKGLFLGAVFDQDLPELVRCDAGRLRQILLNLLGNSLKFTESGGVTVKVGVADWDGDLCDMKFTVHDSGRGFDQARAAMLFDPFVQDRAAVDTSEGTGLGLSICRSLVEALGGAIDCEGVAGEGATFWFTLPLQVLKHTARARAADLTGHKVAVLGGNSPNAVLFLRYFTTRAATIVRAPSLESALAALQPGPEDDLTHKASILIPAAAFAPDLVLGCTASRVVPLLYGSDGSAQIYRQALRAGFAGVLSTAEGPSLLDRNIFAFLGRAQGEQAAAGQATEPAALHASVQSKRVLVLEDRLVNQLIIQKQLAKLRVPYLLVSDGLEGLAALREEEAFDLVLCDCSMPNMNGYEFSRTVRGREKADESRSHLPIVALTANAFREDVEKCHQAGMDDFISKPVSLDRLVAVLNKWLGPAPANEEQAAATNQSAAVDLSVLEEVLGANEPGLMNDVLKEFARSSKQSLATLEAALANGRLNGVQVAAHGAKGEARSAGAVYLGQVYAEVERQAKSGDIHGVETVASLLAPELRRVEAFIEVHLKASSADGENTAADAV